LPVLGLPYLLELVDILVLLDPFHDDLAGVSVGLQDVGSDEFVHLFRWVLVYQVPDLHVGLLGR
jgi:hypothetical protein